MRTLVTLSTSHILAGNIDQAREAASDVIAIDPNYQVSNFDAKHPYKDESYRSLIKNTLRKAGLPN